VRVYRLGYLVQREIKKGPDQASDWEKVHVELDGLKILGLLKPGSSTRVLFGARLNSVDREERGLWSVRFQPDSGVFLTDSRLVELTCPPPDDERTLRKLLEDQAIWATTMP
jgi:hypothetical protein